jgi:hypothetical protein
MTDSSSPLWILIKFCGPVAPVFLIWFIAVTWSIIRLRRQPEVYSLCLTGFTIIFAFHVVAQSEWLRLPGRASSNAAVQQVIDRVVLIYRIFLCAGASLGWWMILQAIFGWRSPSSGPSNVDRG